MFDRSAVEKFYNNYGEREWNRLGATAYGKLVFLLHADFLDPFLAEGKHVLDAGCGPGRFSIYMARAKCRVTLLDMSETQLSIAKEKCAQAGVTDFIDGYIHASVTDLSVIPDNTFDVTVCYGAVFNYLHEQTETAMKELIRVTKNSGEILISVNNIGGIFRTMCIREGYASSFWAKPEEFGIFEVLNEGIEPSLYPGQKHPQRFFYNAKAMKKLFDRKEFTEVAFGSVPCIATAAVPQVEELYGNKSAWETLVQVEKAFYLNDSMLDAGEHLLARAKVRKVE
ncbi:MAG TPA: class I SAM-dependent methyltransferase [Bacillota bacterium]|nr:class I SAM-dependent methyltransferase [Bacillota bacterium]HOK68413.1 class I SAM-dependent methyltransferase [Bacillota bacterium]HPP85148.1 class I SAM-dependent methyltransferase [Bacillota bacterium]